MTKAERNAIKRMDTELFNMANMADSNEVFFKFYQLLHKAKHGVDFII